MRAIFLFLLMGAIALPQIIETRIGVFRGRVVEYQVINGLAVLEGDMILGAVEQIEAETARAMQEAKTADPAAAKAAAIRDDDRARWPQGVIPYTIDAELPNPIRVTDAVMHWNETSLIQLVPRTAQFNSLRFRRQNAEGVCFSSIGMTGGEQAIFVDDGCGSGTLIHEIGHTVGFWHEQSRPDRDAYIQVNEENIDPQYRGQFSIQPNVHEPLGAYDYGSIMHYHDFSFSKNGKPSITTIPAGIPIGQRSTLSDLDLQGVDRLYEAVAPEVTVTTFPEGLELQIDGAAMRSPARLIWAAGSRHTISVNPAQEADDRFMKFARWSDNGELAHEVVHDPIKTVYVANFAPRSRFSLKIEPAGAGRVDNLDPSDDGDYPPATRVRLRAVPNQGFHFLEWEGTLSREPQGLGSEEVVFTTGATRELIARFTAAAPVGIRSEPPGFEILIDGKAVLTPHNFPWNAGEIHQIEATSNGFSGDPFPPRPRDYRVLFDAWAHGGERAQQVVIAAPGQQFTVRYREQFQLSLSTAPRNAGAIEFTPPSIDGFYDVGQELQARAVPGEGFTFAGWTGSLSGKQNPTTYVVSEDRRIHANFGAPGRILENGVVNSASYDARGISPGMIVSIFGLEIGPETPAGAVFDIEGKISTITGDTRVIISGYEAPMIYASHDLVTAVVPYEVGDFFRASVQVEYAGKATEAILTPMYRAIPGIFSSDASGEGQAAAFNQDGTLNSPANPAAPGSIIVFYATGIGQTAPPGENGKINVSPYTAPELPVNVVVGGADADVIFAGGAPNFVAGAVQVNARLSTKTPSGPDVSLTFEVGQFRSQANITIAVR